MLEVKPSVLRLGLLLLGAIMGCTVRAQESPRQPERDFELWTSVALDTRPFAGGKDVSAFRKNFRTSLELGYRSNENLGNGKSYYGDLALKYRAFKWLRVAMNHRYNLRDKFSTNSYRLDGSLTFQGEVKRFEGSYRTIFQHEFIPAFRLRDIWRNRFAITWRTKKFKLDPGLACETFTGIWYKGNYFAGIRYDLGVEWDLGKDHKLEVILRHDREIGTKDPLYRTILSLAYEFYWKR